MNLNYITPLNYRHDIDGLRAIAVCLVILNHADFSFFPGGFVGVDVFFVISGFLITSIVFPRIANNTFSPLYFFSQRIKRLMPALFCVILICSVVFSFILLPQDLQRFYKSTIYVIFYIANFFFWREHGGYFNDNSDEVVLLHTWSLAVEEQYYIIWPIILTLSIKFLKSKKTIYASIVLCIFSTLFSQWATDITIGAAYYLLPTRFFELLAGSCLALVWNHLPTPDKQTSNLLSILGISFILLSALLLNKHSSFPGYNAVYPVVGTVMIIYASTNSVVNRFLATPPIVFTGMISYSLYLWHWPILVLCRYTAINLTLTNQLLVITLIYILSILSWKYIEQPTRKTNVQAFKTIVTNYYVLPSTVLILLALTGIALNGYPSRFSNEIVTMEKSINTHTSKSRKSCHSPYRSSEKKPNNTCIYNKVNPNIPTDIFIFGDSHANHIVPFIHHLAKNSELSVQDYTLDRCLPIFDLKWGSNLRLSERCKYRNDLALKHIELNNFRYVILAASWPDIEKNRVFTNKRVTSIQEKKTIILSKLEETLQQIISVGSIPVILEDIPTLGGKSPKCEIKKELFNPRLNCNIYKNNNVLFSEFKLSMQKKFPKLIIISPDKVFCDNKKCFMSLQNTPLYRDEDHLNEIGANILGSEYLKLYPNPFNQVDNQ